jgi:predicted ATPase/DNA-binding winged helix-turn-helix (wHTH) protein
MTAPSRPPHASVCFGAFRLDLGDERLWRGQEALPLSPKAFAVLRYLLSHAGQLVTKDALFAAVWPETSVSEWALTVTIRALRRALGDQARRPQFIETVHRRGYRFIAPVTLAAPPLGRTPPAAVVDAARVQPRVFVGRETELAQLQQWLSRVLQGGRQVGFIAGEPGIGKTAMVDTFLAQVAAGADVRVAHGQCIEHYGVGEAYLPVLEALGRLGRDADRAPLRALLQRYAPSWLVHLPGLLAPAERRRLAQSGSTVTPARMLRELAEALEILTVERPLVRVLEDLHWSDSATLDWLAYMARRRDPARLLVLGTYRPVEVPMPAHPLRRVLTELHHHAQCAEVVLDYLSEATVASYLQQRFGAKPLPADLARVLHRHTTGNPLFLVAVVDELIRHRVLQESPEAWLLPGGIETVTGLIPASIRGLIARHIDRLPAEDQSLLEAASVAGSTFAIAAVAAAVGMPEEAVETRCAIWMHQGQLLHAAGTETWPDGTVTACYRFRHALYQNAVYERIATGQRLRLHRHIAARLEHGYGEHASDVATELAMHYERGQVYSQALRYRHTAAQNALARGGYAEAIAHLRQGLAFLPAIPQTPERTLHELALHVTLSHALGATQGYAAEEVGQTYARTLTLCEQVGDTLQLFSTLVGLWSFRIVRCELQTARGHGEQLLQLAQRLQDPALFQEAHCTLGMTWFHLGAFATALEHYDQALALYVRQPQRSLVFMQGNDTGVFSYAAYALWMLGYPAQAAQRSQEMLTRLQEGSAPVVGQANAFFHTARLHQLRREVQTAQAYVEHAMALSTAHSLAQLLAISMHLWGWVFLVQEQPEAGLAHMHQGLAAYQATGAGLSHTYMMSLLAEAYGAIGQPESGLAVLHEAFVLVTGTEARWWEAEMYRVKGELLRALTADHGAEAEACLHQALAVARRQQAKSLELRAAMSLSRLWQQQGKRAQAYELLAPIYGWFTEGFDTADLQEAKTLLTALA